MAFRRTGIGVAVLAALSVRPLIPAQLRPPPPVSGPSRPCVPDAVVQIDGGSERLQGPGCRRSFEAGLYGD